MDLIWRRILNSFIIPEAFPNKENKWIANSRNEEAQVFWRYYHFFCYLISIDFMQARTSNLKQQECDLQKDFDFKLSNNFA